jgi:hypothetical protein
MWYAVANIRLAALTMLRTIYLVSNTEFVIEEVSNDHSGVGYPMKGVKGAAQQLDWLSSQSMHNLNHGESIIDCSARMDRSLCHIVRICRLLFLYSSMTL